MNSDHGLLARWKLAIAAARNRRLSAGDLAVLMAVLDCMNDDGLAWPGFKKISIDANVDRSTAVRSVTRLDQSGYLLRESGDRTRSNRYRIGRCESAPSSESTPRRKAAPIGRCESAPGVGASLRLEVGANPRPDLALKNLPIEPTQLNLPTVDRFNEFWASYPRKVSKDAAAKAWTRRKLSSVADAILKDLAASTALGGRWHGKELDFIPYPATYLNGRRWMDEWKPSGKRLPMRLVRDERTDDVIAAANEAALARMASRP